jgi:SAM-dependent methyltransferase
MKKLKILKSWEQDCRSIEKTIRAKAMDGSPLHILEAGCGKYWPIDLTGIQFTLTGVDLDRSALELRNAEFNDLNETIVGDLRSVNLGTDRYDVIYSSYVLEHIDDAERVLDNFLSWLKPGGIVILRIPDRDSVWGFATRFTPFWLHILHARYVRGDRDSGKPGFGPYPTFHDPVVSRVGIHEYCRKNSLVLKEESGHGYYLDRQDAIGSLIRLFVRTVRILSFGKLAWEHCDLTYVLEMKR